MEEITREGEQSRITERAEALAQEYLHHRVTVRESLKKLDKKMVAENAVSTYIGWSLQKLAAIQLMQQDLANAIIGLAQEVRESRNQNDETVERDVAS